MVPFYQEWGIVATIDPIDANNADSATDEVDMSKFHDLAFVISVGAIASSGTFDFKLQGSTTSGGSFSDITGKAITQLTDNDDNKQVIVYLRSEELAQILGNSYRYVKGVQANSAHSQLVSVVVFGRPRFGPATDDDLSSVDEIVD